MFSQCLEMPSKCFEALRKNAATVFPSPSSTNYVTPLPKRRNSDDIATSSENTSCYISRFAIIIAWKAIIPNILRRNSL